MEDKRLSDVLSLAEVAEMLGVTQQAVNKLVQRGRLPHKRIGERSLAFHRKTIERFQERRSAAGKK